MTERVTDPVEIARATRRWMRWGAFVLFLLVFAFPLYKTVEASRRSESLKSQQLALVSGGHQLWGLNCTACHGINGEGASAPALNSQQFLESATDQQIAGIVRGGVPGTEMPAWWNEYGGPLTDQQINEVVAYIRSWEPHAPSNPNWRTPNA